MQVREHIINTRSIAEITSEGIVINTIEDGVDLVGNLYYQGFDKVIIHSSSITPDFFDLKTGIAGDILQKFSNYRIKLAIVGNFDGMNSKSLKDFIFESNKTGHITFTHSVEAALKCS